MKGIFQSAIVVLVMVLAVSCKSKKGMGGNQSQGNVKSCYRLILERDTADLSVSIIGDSVTGLLKFNMFEKDDSEGFIKGRLTDSVIMAEYTFVSEGRESNVNEVMFLLTPNSVVQGYGQLVEVDGKYVFPDSAEINFSSVFEKVPCPE